MTYAQVGVSANTELVTETDDDGNAMETFTYTAGECNRETVLNFFDNMYSITSTEKHPDETCCYYAKLGHTDPSNYDQELKAACTPAAHEGAKLTWDTDNGSCV